jgi:hypothetical protein
MDFNPVITGRVQTSEERFNSLMQPPHAIGRVEPEGSVAKKFQPEGFLQREDAPFAERGGKCHEMPPLRSG